MFERALFLDDELMGRLRRVPLAVASRMNKESIRGESVNMAGDARWLAGVVAGILVDISEQFCAEPRNVSWAAEWARNRIFAAAVALAPFTRGETSHMGVAALKAVRARHTQDLHDAARMLALLPPAYDDALLISYGEGMPEEPNGPFGDGDVHWAGIDRRLRHSSRGCGPSPIFIHRYGPVVVSAERPPNWIEGAHTLLREVEALVAECIWLAAPTAPTETGNESDASDARRYWLNAALRKDAALHAGIERTRRALLLHLQPVRDLEPPKHETLSNWMSMLAMIHVLRAGMDENDDWCRTRDALRRAFLVLPWSTTAPRDRPPPGIGDLAPLLDSREIDEFHDAARVVVGCTPRYGFPAPRPEDDPLKSLGGLLTRCTFLDATRMDWPPSKEK